MAPTPAEGASRSARNVPLLLLFNALAYAYAYVPVSYFVYRERGYALQGFASLRSVYYGSVVLAQLPTGLLADRLGRKPVLVLAPIVQAIGALAISSSNTFGEFALGE